MCSVCTFYVLLLYFGVNQRNISAEVDNNLSHHIYFLNILFHLKQKVAIFNLSSHPVINITATYCVSKSGKGSSKSSMQGDPVHCSNRPFLQPGNECFIMCMLCFCLCQHEV